MLPQRLVHLLRPIAYNRDRELKKTATKTKYNKNIVKPSPLFIFQRKQAIDITTKSNIMKSIVIEQTMPTELTSTGAS